MKIKYLKFKNWLIISLAGLLGINLSCVGREEYGTPEAEFNVKGKVSDSEGNPISGIKVEMGWTAGTTDTDGKYSLKTVDFPAMPKTYTVSFHDIDSIENGLFADDSVGVVFERSDLSGGDGHWYEGSATKTVDITLERLED